MWGTVDEPSGPLSNEAFKKAAGLLVIDNAGRLLRRLDISGKRLTWSGAVSPDGRLVAYGWREEHKEDGPLNKAEVVCLDTGVVARTVESDNLLGVTNSGAVIGFRGVVTGWPGKTHWGPDSVLFTDSKGATRCLVKDAALYCFARDRIYYVTQTTGSPVVKMALVPQ
jgi:hypothetical protein